MTVYVDDPVDWGVLARRKGLRYTVWSHMVADTEEELHAMAAKLGLKRSWYQGHTGLAHYDVTPAKRLKALRLGAKARSARWLAERGYMSRRNEDGSLRPLV